MTGFYMQILDKKVEYKTGLIILKMISRKILHLVKKWVIGLLFKKLVASSFLFKPLLRPFIIVNILIWH